MNYDSPEFTALYPFQPNYHSLDGVRMHYVDEGKGDVVVMLHGNPSWSFLYRDLIKALRGEFRVIAPDHIGMGRSDKPQAYCYQLRQHIDNLERLLDSVVPAGTPISLVVHDWGGAIGMGWAVRHPERVANLVILNTAAFPSPRIPGRINLCRCPGFGALAIRGFNAFAGGAVSMAVGKPMSKAVKSGFLLPYDSWANRIATLRFVQDIPLDEQHVSYPALEEIAQKLPLLRGKPVLIQWGGADWCFDHSFYDEWLRRFPHAEYESYPQAGHYLLEDAGEVVIPRIRYFLRAHRCPDAPGQTR